MFNIFLFCGALSFYLIAESMENGITNRTQVEVGSQVITSRHVLLSGYIDRWLLLNGSLNSRVHESLNQVNRQGWLLKEGSENFEKQLSQLVFERVIVLEAKSLSLSEPSQEQVESLTEKMITDLKNWQEGALQKWEKQELQTAIRLKLQAQNFLRIKINSSGVVPSEDEIKKYYQQNKVKFGGLPLLNFKDNIRDYLGQKALENRLKDWYDILKKKHKVRYLKSSHDSKGE